MSLKYAWAQFNLCSSHEPYFAARVLEDGKCRLKYMPNLGQMYVPHINHTLLHIMHIFSTYLCLTSVNTKPIRFAALLNNYTPQRPSNLDMVCGKEHLFLLLLYQINAALKHAQPLYVKPVPSIGKQHDWHCCLTYCISTDGVFAWTMRTLKHFCYL